MHRVRWTLTISAPTRPGPLRMRGSGLFNSQKPGMQWAMKEAMRMQALVLDIHPEARLLRLTYTVMPARARVRT